VNACCCSLLLVDQESRRNAGCTEVPTAEKLKKLVKKNTWNAGCTQVTAPADKLKKLVRKKGIGTPAARKCLHQKKNNKSW